MSVVRRSVIATLKVVGFHRWPGAPIDVAYLADQHRHLFTVRVEFNAAHAERDVEFHTAQRWLREALQTGWETTVGEHDFGAMSCEAIAQQLESLLSNRGQVQSIEVWEDGENGARVCFEYDK